MRRRFATGLKGTSRPRYAGAFKSMRRVANLVDFARNSRDS